MDNLKLIEERIVQDIDPNGIPGSVLAENHQEIEKEILKKTGKYTGQPFVAYKSKSILTAGCFSWENNPMNKTEAFVVKASSKTSDGILISRILELMGAGSIIHFKDYIGRTCLLEFVSYKNNKDGNSNDIVEITVKGFSESINYTYQDSEIENSMLSFYMLSGTDQEINFESILESPYDNDNLKIALNAVEEIEVTTGGNKNNFNLNGKNIIVVNTTTEALFSGFTDANLKEVVLINRGEQSFALMSENTSSLAANRLKLPYNKINVPKNGVVRIYESELENRWKIADATGIPYHIAFPDLTEDKVLTVGVNGELKSNDSIDLFEKDDIKSALYKTDLELNNDYPNTIKGIQVLVTQTRQICEKLDNQPDGKWFKSFVDFYVSDVENCIPNGTNISNSTLTAQKVNHKVILRGSFDCILTDTTGDGEVCTLPSADFYPASIKTLVTSYDGQLVQPIRVEDDGSVRFSMRSGSTYEIYVEFETLV